MVFKFIGKIRQLPRPVFFLESAAERLFLQRIFTTDKVSLFTLYRPPRYQLFQEPWGFQIVTLNLGRKKRKKNNYLA